MAKGEFNESSVANIEPICNVLVDPLQFVEFSYILFGQNWMQRVTNLSRNLGDLKVIEHGTRVKNENEEDKVR